MRGVGLLFVLVGLAAIIAAAYTLAAVLPLPVVLLVAAALWLGPGFVTSGTEALSGKD